MCSTTFPRHQHYAAVGSESEAPVLIAKATPPLPERHENWAGLPCAMQSSATRLTSSAMRCRWHDPVSVSTAQQSLTLPGLTLTYRTCVPLLKTPSAFDGLPIQMGSLVVSLLVSISNSALGTMNSVLPQSRHTNSSGNTKTGHLPAFLSPGKWMPTSARYCGSINQGKELQGMPHLFASG
jgi:hypothetical protein